MKKQFSNIFLLLSIIVAQPLFAQIGIEPNEIKRIGQSGWQFLKINSDPRQAAMGGAFAAISKGDANAIFGNPAALVDVYRLDLQLNNTNWIADIKLQSISFSATVDKLGTFAVSFITLDYGDIPETINSPVDGENITIPYVTGNYFSARDIAAGISYARKITDRLSLGGNLRWIRQRIDDLSMTNWALDIGTMYYTGYRGLRIAITAKNFGPDSHLVGWSEEYQSEPVDVRMPIDFRLGMAMDFFDEEGSPHLLTVVAEGDHPNDSPEKIHTGLEYVFNHSISVRGGYKFNYDEQGLTFGAGVNYSYSNYAGTINYAFVDFGALRQVHMFSLGFSF